MLVLGGYSGEFRIECMVIDPSSNFELCAASVIAATDVSSFHKPEFHPVFLLSSHSLHPPPLPPFRLPPSSIDSVLSIFQHSFLY
jgi:hypothetical protein